ncbi:MAG: hypothetical protein ACJAU6_002276 [Alphaproteobacteria bacterium]|jgi:uncharacterized protein (TIGR02118 family)
MRKTMAFLKRRDGMERRDFFDWWLNEHRPFAEQIPGLRHHTISLVADDGDAEFDGVGEYWFDDTAATDSGVASPAGQAAKANSDAATSRQVVVEFVEHKFIDTGEPAPFKMISILKRADEMKRPEFKEWWLDSHAPMVLQFPDLRHYQVDLAEDGPDGAIDGLAELSFEDMETLRRVIFSDQVRSVQQQDSVSHTSSIIRMYVEKHAIF